ncbi:PREDICTED: uncharacterized protein LOC108970148 [Bactrocera latifrons]|uniref:uncharacterized protein LOC108970148 n=1 Tax=Bactrocera latifrons TaxID=174628 RepID=UPI0008DCD855|nr:PREDICTED: uncharacterized protein LOC108970148 [Bactrocera latifrons]
MPEDAVPAQTGWCGIRNAVVVRCVLTKPNGSRGYIQFEGRKKRSSSKQCKFYNNNNNSNNNRHLQSNKSIQTQNQETNSQRMAFRKIQRFAFRQHITLREIQLL